MKKRFEEIQEAKKEDKVIIYVGLDVHKNSYQSYCFNSTTGEVLEKRLGSTSKAVGKLDKELREKFGEDCYILYGYEAGPTGDKLKRDLDKMGFNCDIIPLRYVVSTRFNNQIKTDKRDAATVAYTLELQKYTPVFVPDETDKSVRSFIRMREDLSNEFKRIKQYIKSFILARNLKSPKKTKTWDEDYLEWLYELDLSEIDRETLNSYLYMYQQYAMQLKMLNKRIDQIARDKRYRDRVERLCCIKGIGTLIALTLIVEISDFKRFEKPGQLASYLGLVPREYSSGSKVVKGGITKTGNKFLRKLLILAAQSAVRGKKGIKNSHQSSKSKGNSEQMIIYAQKADNRIHDKFYRMILGQNKPRNVAITAIARELINFVWGAMTDHIA